ncbi:MAG: undecaprenyl-diphosphate phosphatase, partial [Pseudomonadota bacterium]
MSFIEAIILGIVEGLTEFLPVSSTGHLILTRDALGLSGALVDRQLIIIQGAAILAVCWEFRKKLLGTAFSLHSDPIARRFVLNLFISSVPLAVLGLIFKDQIEAVLFKPVPVAIALVVGGVIILWAERRTHEERIQNVDELRPIDALKLGLFQALALIPGTSRSGAT